ncbi:MAG: hypothetical protein HY431_01865 [Candidatus Levybacteria bacterium]|nr:hypothetical protein [Candidatus Levybacteria bacterium]
MFKKLIAGASLGLAALVLSVSLASAQEAGSGDAFTDGPSAFCHVTDGAFTDCDVNNGVEEWSDITPSFFDVFADVPGPESALYVDQADKHPTRSIPNGSGIDTLMLMYDEMFRTTPLLLGETVHVHFMTVDEGALAHYDVLIGAGGITEVKINGVVQSPMPSGLLGKAGYGPSPNNPLPHVMAELQIGLEAAGFTSEECCYSPDPAWWGSDVPDNPQGTGCPRDGQQDGTFDGNLDGIIVNGDGHDDQCIPGDPVSTTAGIFTAHLDGRTTVDPAPLLPVGDEPPLCESLARIVNFRGGDDKLAEQLVQSQIDAGLITEEEAVELLACILGRMTGGGSVLSNVFGRVTHGFELHCNAAEGPNRLEVNWGKGNKFHLEILSLSLCSNDPIIVPNPPPAGFDTYQGAGTGRYNGVSGATAKWVFTDAGEPGKNDKIVSLVIKDVNDNEVLNISGDLKVGNHQAHAH